MSKQLVGQFRYNRKPLRVADLAELLTKYDWGRQLDVLSYMKRFKTWDALYDDLEMRQRQSADPTMRNVTPEKPKQLRENNG